MPFVPWAHVAPETFVNDAGVMVIRQLRQFRESLRSASPSALALAAIEVERINGPVLLMGAQDDHVWPSCDLAQMAFDRLRDAGHGTRFINDAVVCFEGAGHGFSPALAGLPAGDANEGGTSGTRLDFGGSPIGTGQGSRAAWRRSVTFLNRALKND